MGCFDTGKLSDSGTKNGSVTPVWVGGLLVQVRLCRANMMTVADAKRFVASRRARRSGIAAPLCHIWLPAAPLRQLASSYDHACKSSPALHRMHAWWNPDQVLGKSALFMIFRLEAVPESIVRRYFLQVLVGWIYRFPGSQYAFPTQEAGRVQGEETLFLLHTNFEFLMRMMRYGSCYRSGVTAYVWEFHTYWYLLRPNWNF